MAHHADLFCHFSKFWLVWDKCMYFCAWNECNNNLKSYLKGLHIAIIKNSYIFSSCLTTGLAGVMTLTGRVLFFYKLLLNSSLHDTKIGCIHLVWAGAKTYKFSVGAGTHWTSLICMPVAPWRHHSTQFESCRMQVL